MKKVKFYALVCRNMSAVRRHVETIPKEDLVIVINSMDHEFSAAAVAYCEAESIAYKVTVSDSGAATGKNSVFDTFLESDNDYAVMVDGDDFLTPHGVWTYKQLAQSESPPDAVALEYQYGLYRESGYGLSLASIKDRAARSPTFASSDPTNPAKIHGHGIRVFLKPKEWWDKSIQGDMVNKIPGNEHSYALSDVHQRWTTHCHKYISNWESHLRVVWYSRKVASEFRFDNNFRVGEDTLMLLELKHAHMNNQIVLKTLFERYPTYVYDTRIGGIVYNEKDVYGEVTSVDYGWYLWLKKLTEKYDQLEAEGKMHEAAIPRIKIKAYVWEDPTWDQFASPAPEYDIVWPEGYRPDTLGLVSYPGKRVVHY